MIEVNSPSGTGRTSGRSANVRTALILVFIAAIFFVAVVIRHSLW